MSAEEQMLELGQRAIGRYGCYSCHEIQGFEDTHAEARAAAEACLVERGIDINWLGPRESQKRASPKPRWTKPKL